MWLFSAGLALMLPAALARSSSLGLRVQEYVELDGGTEDNRVVVNDAPARADNVAHERTLMQCLGTQTMTRACHFENVYYDLNTSRFVHYGVAGATPGMFGDDYRPEDPWLRLVR